MTQGTRGSKKLAGAQRIWAVEFPGRPFPSGYYGAAHDAYRELEERGWVWSSRSGWHKGLERLTLEEVEAIMLGD